MDSDLMLNENKFTWSQFVNDLKNMDSQYPRLKIAYLAQCILESASGTSDLFVQLGNPTGLKFRPEMEGFANSVWLRTPTEPNGENWCSWDTPIDAIKGYWRFISRSIYSGWESFSENPEAYIKHIVARGYATDPKYTKKVIPLFIKAIQLLQEGNIMLTLDSLSTDEVIASWFNLDLGQDREAILYAMNSEQSISSLKSPIKKEILAFLDHHDQAKTLRLSQKVKVIDKEQLNQLNRYPNDKVSWFQFWRNESDNSTVLVGFSGGNAINAIKSNNTRLIIDFLKAHPKANTVQAANMESVISIVSSPVESSLGRSSHGSTNAAQRPSNIEVIGGCPNYSSRGNQGIDAIVLHYTTSRNVQGSISWFKNPESEVSAHYIVDRDGKIYQLVNDSDKAWHCYGFNTTSIGIEHVAQQGDRLTSEQENSSVQLIRWLCKEYKISKDRIFGHNWNPNQPGGTSCPGSLWHSAEELREWVEKNVIDVNEADIGSFNEDLHPAASEALRTSPIVKKLIPDSPFELYVTPHIQYGEICKWEERRRFVTQTQCDVSLKICQFLETVRSAFNNRPVIITSGHRPRPVNEEQGGAIDSEHLYNQGRGAIDFYIDGADVYNVQDYCLKEWPYSVGRGAPKGFVHIGYGRGKVQWDY
ncbi:N-acetylmuramoyl-L-alanine amidase [Altericista sp. CCNU0014]|uniref:N-acetylmuramoyl-L-alanine amidase n=1 Tax=Altericista sp. CCNU0014 TaxID=3082949 RepID=UPI00384B1ED4